MCEDSVERKKSVISGFEGMRVVIISQPRERGLGEHCIRRGISFALGWFLAWMCIEW